MTVQPGKTIYLADGTGTGAVALAGLRTTQVTFDGKSVEVTSRDSSGFQELIGSAGVVKVTVKVDGMVTDNTQMATLASRQQAQSLNAYTIDWGSAHTIAGMFQVTQFEPKGTYNDAQTFSATLESSGSMTLV